MKKLSLVLLLVLALCLGLAACNQTASTARVTRWSDNEEYEFAITKAALDSESQDGYAKEYAVRGEANPNEMDEKVPEDVRGTFKMKIAVADKVCTFTTEMEIYSLYTTEYYDSLPQNVRDQLEQKDGFVIRDAAAVDTMFGEADRDSTVTGVAIKSTTNTLVQFNNDKAQRPIHSEKTYNGYYFGKTTQEVNASSITVDYNLSKNKVSVKVDDGNAVEKSIKVNSKSDIIDANQLLLYIRSMEKTENSFKDSPSVQIYDPIYNVVRSATFSMTYTGKTFIEYTHEQTTGEGEQATTTTVTDTLKAKLTCVAAVVDGQVFMVQMNLPAYVNNDAKLDIWKDASADYNKYTTVRFRSGYKAFELVNYNGLKDSTGNEVGAQIIEAIKKAVQ